MKLRYKIIISVAVTAAVIFTGSALLAAEHLIDLCFAPVMPENARDSEYYIPQEENLPGKDTDIIELAAQISMNESYEWLRENAFVKSIQSFDNLTLKAYVAANESHNWLIAMHGYKEEPRSMAPYALHFFSEGFNVAVPGLRGHGWSEGTFMDMGYFCADDVKSWCEEIVRTDPEARILILGVSEGAVSVLLSLNKTLPANVVCAVSDSAYSSAWAELSFRLSTVSGLPEFPLLNITSFIAEKRYGFNIKNISPIESVKKSTVPVLFIHGAEDTFIPVSMLSELYDAASCTKDRYEVPGASHGRSLYADTFSYWEKVDTFVRNFFLP